MAMRSKILKYVNKLLSPSGIEIKRRPMYLDVGWLHKEARRCGKSIYEYMDSNKLTTFEERELLFNNLDKLGALTPCTEIVEIGPGTGFFLVKHLELNNPEKYHIFEIDKAWVKYLSQTYDKVIAYPANGHSLKGLGDGNCGLCAAHGVFVYIPYLDCCRYFYEMIRVCKSGGYMVFDILSDKEWDQNIIETWLYREENWPVVLPEAWVIKLFVDKGCNLIGRFNAKTVFGISSYSTYLVFRKN
jgi:hypothetical protein